LSKKTNDEIKILEEISERLGKVIEVINEKGGKGVDETP
jgi:hypothetical protein